MPMNREQLLQMQASGRLYQERYDNALAPWDQRAPAPVLGQSIDDYRRDTLVKIKKLLPRGHELRKVKIYELRNDALDVLEPQLLKACRSEAYSADSVPPGELRRVVEIDQGGTKMVRWIGQQSFVKEIGRAGRRVVSFMHKYDASGRALG
jgi:hypothetical protein